MTKIMSKESAVSAIEKGDLSELQHVLEESEWDVGSDPLNSIGQTALHIACDNGHLGMVQYLVIKKDCTVAVEDFYGNTPLMCLIIHKHWKIANFLLQRATNSAINEVERIHMEIVAEEALVASCQNGYFALVKFITKISRQVVDYKETIQLARRSDNLHIVKYLLTHCQCTMPDDMSEVHIACVQGDVETVKTALDSNGSSILGTADYFGIKPIHYATSEPNLLRMIVQCAGEMLLNITDNMGNTPLHYSTKYECIESVTILVEHPECDVNLANLKEDTPLIAACKYSNSTIVQLLVASEKCDINTRDSEGNTALHIAVSGDLNDQLENVRCLLQSDRCDPNVINQSGRSPLHIVSHRGFIPLLEVLVTNKRCDLNIQDGNGDTALHIGVENVEVVKCLLESGRSRCDIYNKKGLTPFHKAIVNGIVESVEVMLKTGVNILHTSNDEFRNAPIHIACIYSRLDILKVLLDCTNCDPNQQNAVGDTALHIVCRKRTGKELQFFEVLTSTPGINTTLVNIEGITPCDALGDYGNTLLHIACAEGNSRMVDFLMKNGVDVLKPDKHGDAPIHITCKYSQLEILRVLLDSTNCDPNQQNAHEDTAMHIVCRKRTGRELQFLQVLTSTPGTNPTIVNYEDIAPFDVVGSDGNTLLHIACASGNSTLVELLIKKGIDILKSNRQGDAPIHIACKHSQLDVLKELFNCSSCNPDQQNADGDTALHIVSRMGGSSEKTRKNAQIVEFLLKNGADILKPDRHGDAPIHIACMYSRLNVLNVLLGCTNCDLNQQNADGDTALHIVCKMISQQKVLKTKFLETLISTPGINPEIANYEGYTFIEYIPGRIGIIRKFREQTQSSIQAYLKIFVVGNSGTGKSTLIKAVITEASQLVKYSPLPKMKYVKPSDVPPHTAGIVPIPFNSKHFGNAVLYDFAGQHEYYSSHAAVMENLILLSPPLFLLLIDISKSKEVIREELLYWWHFINNQSQKAAAPPHVILAGSHKDMVISGDRDELEIMISDWIKEIPVTFEFVGYFPLDCRKLVSQGLSALLTQLNTTCQTLRRIVDINLHCHILNSLLRAPEFQHLVYCKAGDIVRIIECGDIPLPQTFSQLIPLFASLNDQGHILLLQNHTDESKSWVILKPDVLFTEVNGSVFAPKYFEERSQFAMSTGVVPLSKLKEKFTEYNHEIIVEYLTHLEFCFRIKDQHTLDMITKNTVQESETDEEYYFFPALVHVENPTDVCQRQPHSSIDYECGWLYRCHKETEQLTTRFLHVLILRLAFACKPRDDPTETESVVLLRSCSVWKHGIAWWTNDGIEVIVEVGLQCRWVAVMLRCPATERVQCAELRSKVISTVLKTKTKFCPAITMNEYLIAPSSLKYPFEGRQLTLYSMREIARATVEGKKFAKDTEGKNVITLPQLLPFEPYHNMGSLIWKFFNGDTSLEVTPEELSQLAKKCYDKLAELKTAFKPDVGSFQRDCMRADCTEVGRCVALFHILQRRGRFKTWRDFQQEFSRFSIFCEQSPLVRMR